MSAILKALRRIEAESAGEAQSQSFSKRVDAKKVISQRARKAWVFRRTLSILVPCLVLAAVIGLIFALKTFLPRDGVLLSPLFRTHGEDGKGASLPTAEPGSTQARMTEEAHGTLGSNEAREALRSPTGSSPAKERPSPSGTRPDTATTYRGSGRSVLSAENRSEREPNPDLELQAIVWSDDPASCFAVINGRIVRSGGMVGGVSVVDISKDAVSLKLGDRAWTVRMLEGD